MVLGVLLVGAVLAAGGPSVDGLLTEYRTNPLGLDTLRPGFSWKMISAERGARQTAYQIQVASSEEILQNGKPDMEDSGRVESSQCTAIPYSGKPLKSRTIYYWRVKIWDGGGKASSFSRTATFETALLDPGEWQGRWIKTKSRGGNGYHSQFGENVDTAKWVQVDLGKAQSFNKIVLYPARPYNWRRDEPGFGFPVRYRVEVSEDADFTSPRVIADRTSEDQANPGANAVEIGVGEQFGRYVRLVAAKLAHPKDTSPLFALAEMEVVNSSGKDIAEGTSVKAMDSIEDSGWNAAQLTDGSRVSSNPTASTPMLRCEFKLDKPVKSARAYVTGLGYYELRLNGKKVGDRVLDPARTQYDKRIYYSAYDITNLLRPGTNAVGALLGEGWWKNSPQFLLQMDVDYTDGTTARVISNDTWRWTQSPILQNSLYGGETYDATKEQPGWDKPGFDDSKWQPVTLTDMPTSKLCAEAIQPIKVVETLAPKSMIQPKPGVYVFDFGQNFSGWCRLKVAGDAGAKVTLKHAEVLFADGTVNQNNLRSARATDTYILRGEETETYEPRFTYHGFRYVQVEGYPGKPNLDCIRGCVVHTSFEPRGSFECSNDLINAIQRNSLWGERTNFHSIPTDCPQRDERQGWMGDAWMTASSMFMNFDMSAAYIKFLQDISDAQREDGAVPDTVPQVWGNNPGDPMWSIAYPMILWETFKNTGDMPLLDKHYDGIKRYVELLRREAGDGVLSRNTYGDWVAVAGTPKDLISTGAYYQTVEIAAQMAHALGLTEDEKNYQDLCTKIAAAFNSKFLNTENGQYGNGSQFSYAMPLALNITPVNFQKSTLNNLLKDIHGNHKDHLSTGFIGTPYLIDALSDIGRADVAYKIAVQEDYPGWGYMVKRGATTIWELWQYEDGNGMNSHNHPAFSLVSGWFYRNLAGINIYPQRPGWEHFLVKPQVVGDLKWAKANVQTLRGQVAVDWKLTGTGIRMSVMVPANSSATVYVPKVGRQSFEIREGDGVIWRNGAFVPARGIAAGADAGEWVSFEVGSGNYEFELGPMQ